MEIFDRIYDKDAYIEGVIINKKGDDYKVLWNNGVYGNVREEYEEIKVVGHINFKKFYVVDILHTGHHGKEMESKVGEKYDRRRNKILLLDMDSLRLNHTIVLNLFDEDEFEDKTDADCISVDKVYTTAYEKMYKENDLIYLRTLNSIYVLEEL